MIVLSSSRNFRTRLVRVLRWFFCCKCSSVLPWRLSVMLRCRNASYDFIARSTSSRIIEFLLYARYLHYIGRRIDTFKSHGDCVTNAIASFAWISWRKFASFRNCKRRLSLSSHVWSSYPRLEIFATRLVHVSPWFFSYKYYASSVILWRLSVMLRCRNASYDFITRSSSSRIIEFLLYVRYLHCTGRRINIFILIYLNHECRHFFALKLVGKSLRILETARDTLFFLLS
jgi:hypothetical protein